MKRFKMPSQKEFQAMYPPQNAAFDEAVRQTVASLPNDGRAETRMKRKISVGLAAALVLALALACAAVAASLGVFGRMAEETRGGYADLYRTLEERSTELGETRTTNARDIAFTLKQAYADGDSLFIAYELTDAQKTVDYTWKPTEAELAEMRQRESLPTETGDAFYDAFIRKMLEDGAKNGFASAKRYEVYLSDGAYLAGTDEYLNILSGDETVREDGVMLGIKELELPEALKGEESLSVELKLYKAVYEDVFDGERWYEHSGRTEEPLRVDIPLNTNEEIQTYRAERTFEAYHIEVEVSFSDVKMHVKAAMKSLNGQVLGSEKFKEGALAAGQLYVDGQKALPISGTDEGVGTTSWTIEEDYARPDVLPQKAEWVPVYDTQEGDGERTEEAVTVWLGHPAALEIRQACVDDGMLFLAYEASGLDADIDYTWKPTEAELAEMRQTGQMDADSDDEVLSGFVREMVRLAAKAGEASAAVSRTRCSFGAYLSGTEEYLEPRFSNECVKADGTAIGMKMFDIPTAYQGAESLPMKFELFEEKTYYRYDGSHWFILRGEQKTEGNVSVDVPLESDEVLQTYGAEKTFGTVRAVIKAEITNTVIRTSVDMQSADGPVFSEKNENWKKGRLAELNLYIDGEAGVVLTGQSSGMETADYTEQMVYVKPWAEPKELTWIPVYYTADGDGVHLEERPEEAVTIPIQ